MTNMRKCFLISFLLIAASPAKAQIDVKLFDKIGPDAILTLLHNPIESWSNMENVDGLVLGDCDYDEDGLMYYGPCEAVIAINDEDYSLIMFSTASPKFVFLTSIVEGGIKVGDSYNRIRNIDFVHSKYGRNKAENGLVKIVSWKGIDQYCLFGEEYEQLYLRFKDGVLIDIIYDLAQELPYKNYDFSNKLL